MSKRMTRTKLCSKAALLAIISLLALPAQAADVVTDAMQTAYGPYRMALFKTNSNSQAEARMALDQARQSWTQLTARFGSKPPAPYDRDLSFGSSLAEISKVFSRATEQVAANQLSAAHETLEAARDILSVLRQRNHVIVYSDHMNAYHSEMEHLLIDGPKMLAQVDGMQKLTASVGVLSYLSKKLKTEAPFAYASDGEFNELLRAVGTSVADLEGAVLAQNAVAVKEAMTKLKAPYGKLFLKFG
jgi:hypothetical protein